MRNESIVGVGMITDSLVLDAAVVVVVAAADSGDTMKLCLCRAVVAEPPTPSESAAILHGGNIV